MKKNLPYFSAGFTNSLVKLCLLVFAGSLLVFVQTNVNAQPIALKHLAPGSGNYMSNNGYLYFSSADSLWRSDGTPEGTTLVKKLGAPISVISEVTLPNAIFLVTQGVGNQSLWRSDGTNAGTIMVGTYPSIIPLIVYNNELYLSINDGVRGVELWKLSASNTLTLVKDINPGGANGYFGPITIYNNSLFFKAGTAANSDIWKSNGTEASTALAINVPFNDFYDLKASAGYLYFSRSYQPDPDNMWYNLAELWSSQGTTASTSMIQSWENDITSYNHISNFTELNGLTYFFHTHHLPMIDLWVTNGVNASFVKNVNLDGSVSEIQILNNYMIFADESQSFFGSIWKSDGTAEGTTRFHGMNQQLVYPGGFDKLQITPVADLLFFADAREPIGGTVEETFEIYQSDLTSAGTKSLEEIYGESFKGASNITAAGDKVFFTASGTGAFRLWFYDPYPTPLLCSGTAGVAFERWNNVSGTTVATIPVNTTPVSITTLTTFEGPSNIGDKYGSRYRALLCVPQTGNYRFWIASNDNSELWLSTTSHPSDKVRIAYVNGATNPRQYNKYASQQSALIHLEQGNTYYIEALHKEGVGTDHLSVGMQLPDGTLERPIAHPHLIRYTEEPICSASGTILHEVWWNVGGTSASDVPVNAPPSETSQLTMFEAPANIGIKYAARIRGYVCPPTTGNYTFYIASNDNSELWLSSDSDPANKVRIAYVNGATNPGQWNKYSSQTSLPVALTQNQSYYVEVLHKQGVGTDHVAVGWMLPDGILERPIPGSRLSPFDPSIFMAGMESSQEDVFAFNEGFAHQVLLSPNPAGRETVTLSLVGYEAKGINTDLNVEITSLVGSRLYSKTISCADGCSNIPLDAAQTLSAGTYLVSGTINGKRFARRLIIK